MKVVAIKCSNSFLYNAINIFVASFPIKYKSIHNAKNDQFTQGIKISFRMKGKYALAGQVTIQN
jgi:hypothetical protein